MNSKKVGIPAVLLIVLLISVMFSGRFVPSAKAATFPNLPTSSVNIEVTSPAYTYPLTIVLSNVPSGYDVTNGPYTGYCADLLTTIQASTTYSATLVSSLTIPGDEWNEINYILNNVPAGATGQDIQAAIWLAQEPFTAAQIMADGHITPSALATTLAANSELYGETFIPGPGQIVTVMIAVSGEQALLIPLREPTPPSQGNIFVPSGPTDILVGNPSEWISPTLAVFTWSGTQASSSPIGWKYTDGPTYNALTEKASPKIPAEDPAVYTSTGTSTLASALSTATTTIPYGSQVIVVGFIPGVTASVDAVPPPVELQINWNGVPNTVTLSVPASQIVGVNYPPTMYSNIATPYQFAYPASTGSKTATQMASYNLWMGNYAQVLARLWGTSTVPAWWNKVYGSSDSSTNGEWFWYTYTPNAGDYIALDSNGQVSTPPTYDITAMFEYGTSQIWFNHVNFNVLELMTHKDVSYCTCQTINDVINITNVGLVTATGLDIQQTFPDGNKILESPTSGGIQVVSYDTKGNVVPVTGTMQLTSAQLWGIQYPNDLVISTANGFPAAYTTLAPGQSLIITLEISVSNVGSGIIATTGDDSNGDPSIGSGFVGTIVYDSLTSCNQIAPWKDPIALAALPYPCHLVTDGVAVVDPPVSLWDGLYLGDSGLFGEPSGHIDFSTINAIGGVSSIVAGPILRTPLSEPAMAMTLDPTPVPLIAGETSVTQADVAMVRNALLGLAPYDQRMDCNGNGIIDVQDLNAYMAAAGN